MKSKNLFLGMAALALAVLVALGGCSREGGQEQATEAGAKSQQGQNLGNATRIADLESRLKESPNNPEVLWRLGDAYFDSKQFHQSADYYKKVLEVKPGEADLYNDLGLSLHYIGESAEGLRYVEDGIKKNPYHQRIWLTKGFILAYGTGDMEGAKAAWEKASALNPESQIGKAASEYLAALSKQ